MTNQSQGSFDISDRPPLITLRYSSIDHRRLDITGLKSHISRFIDDSTCFRVSPEFQKELYIFGKILYKMHGPFRRHGHFQMAKRLKKLLDNCFSGDQGQLKIVSGILREFTTSIRLDEKDNLYCPSGEYFRFLLATVRMLTSVFVKIVRCCLEFCERMMHMLNFGHFVQVHCLLLGVVARFRSDCCRRLRVLRDFLVDFESQGHLANGLRLNCISPASAESDTSFLETSDGSEVDQILESDLQVNSQNLSPTIRKQAIDYFENLFNVRLVEQKARRRRMGPVKKEKSASQGLNFRQALGVVSSPASDRLIDLGIPVSRPEKVTRTDEEPGTARLDDYLAQLNRVKSIKALRKFATRLESVKDHRLRASLRYVRKELGKIEKGKDDKDSKALTKVVKRVRQKLSHCLTE